MSGLNVYGSLKPPESSSEWPGEWAFKIDRQYLGRSPKDQTCHHEVWIQLSLVSSVHVTNATVNETILFNPEVVCVIHHAMLLQKLKSDFM